MAKELHMNERSYYMVTSLAIILFCNLPILGFSQKLTPLTIINHLAHPIRYFDYTSEKSYDNAAFKQTNILVYQDNYYRVIEIPSQEHNAFFGISLAGKKIQIHGYIDHQLAYSYSQNPAPYGSITFCTPSYYEKYNSCALKS